MKRHFRNLVFFIIGLALGGFATFALSATATFKTNWGTFDSRSAACTGSFSGWLSTQNDKQYSNPHLTGDHSDCSVDHPYYGKNSNGYKLTVVCPYGYNVQGTPDVCDSLCPPYTLPQNVSGTLACIKPTCSTGTVLQADGSCYNKCTATANQTQTFFYRTATSPIGRTFCIPETGCEGIVSQATPQYDCGSGDIIVCYQGFQVTAMSTPSACSSSTASLPPTSSPIPANKPPCGPDQGVLTSSSGKVACVPSGTPSATPPKVGAKTTTTQNADGSTTVNNTTTTCTGAGSCSSTTITTVTNSSGQSSTTTKTTDSNSTNGGSNSVGATGGVGGGGGGGGGDAGCDPTVQMCSSPETAGLYTKKEETFAGPLSRFTSGLKSSVLGQNATGFFTVSIPSGSCPNWVASQSVMGRTFVVDFRPVFCSEAADKTMQIIGTVLMVVAAFGAFRWAFL